MQIFINDLSLEGQFFSSEDFKEAVKVFTGIFSLINEKVKEKQMYKDSLFINRNAIRNEHFQASFQRIGDPTLKIAFQDIVFNKLNPKDWRQEQLHSIEDDFLYLTEDEPESVTNTTLAEVAERILQDNKLICLLVNFVNSRFKERSCLSIQKNCGEDNLVGLDCVEDSSSLEVWLEETFNLGLFEYDCNSKDKPTDIQTTLRDKTRFEVTTFKVQGRRVYKEVKTGYFWYVDNYHFGSAAHLEVFNSETHLGEADLDGNIDLTKGDRNKRLTIK